jgi:hypothetical protein
MKEADMLAGWSKKAPFLTERGGNGDLRKMNNKDGCWSP